MALLTTPEKETARRTHVWLLLLGGLAVLILVTALALLSVEDDAPGVATAVQSGGESPLATPSPGVVNLLGDEDPVEAGAAQACAQFRNGTTVVQLAAWFEAEVGPVGPEEEELFQAIVLRALTQTCPDVIPGG